MKTYLPPDDVYVALFYDNGDQVSNWYRLHGGKATIRVLGATASHLGLWRFGKFQGFLKLERIEAFNCDTDYTVELRVA